MSESRFNLPTLMTAILISVILSVAISYSIISREPGPEGPPGPPGESYSYEEFLEYISEELETVKTWSGSASITTELFYVPVNQIKITWELETTAFTVFGIVLYEEGADVMMSMWMIQDDPQGVTYAYIEPGYYYLDLAAANCEYTVTVETVPR